MFYPQIHTDSFPENVGRWNENTHTEARRTRKKVQRFHRALRVLRCFRWNEKVSELGWTRRVGGT